MRNQWTVFAFLLVASPPALAQDSSVSRTTGEGFGNAEAIRGGMATQTRSGPPV